MVQLGDLQSEEERDVVLELTLPATGEEASDWTVVSAKLTYFNVITSVMEDVQYDLKVQRKQEGLSTLRSTSWGYMCSILLGILKVFRFQFEPYGT